jgi:multidrug transporter EmrE-like cation transporter
MLLILTAQVISYIQLQGPGKWPILRKYEYVAIFAGVPIGYLLITATRMMNSHFGATWPGRLIGQGIGLTVFYLMSFLLFRESMTAKTAVCITLSILIILINIYWK